jgi:hypothetical protein
MIDPALKRLARILAVEPWAPWQGFEPKVTRWQCIVTSFDNFMILFLPFLLHHTSFSQQSLLFFSLMGPDPL